MSFELAKRIYHINGSTSGTPDTAGVVKFTHVTNAVLIDNLSTTDTLQVSFDGGTNYKTICKGGSLSVAIDGLITLSVKSPAATVGYEILYGTVFI